MFILFALLFVICCLANFTQAAPTAAAAAAVVAAVVVVEAPSLAQSFVNIIQDATQYVSQQWFPCRGQPAKRSLEAYHNDDCGESKEEECVDKVARYDDV